MKLAKSLLLGSAAGLATVAAAQAADLPTRKAAPVEYVRVCDAYGAGFFYIPGTDTCLRVGGLVLAQMRIQGSKDLFAAAPPTPGTAFGFVAFPSPAGFRPSFGTTRDIVGYDAVARVELDARTQSPWGTVRTFVRVVGQYGSGLNATTGSFQSIGGGLGLINNTVGPTTSKELVYLDKAFIQFAGLTAGRVQSFFDFYADAINYEALRGSNQNVWALAYTWTFGGGFSATLAVEDTASHRGPVANVTNLPGLAPIGAFGVLTGFALGAAAGDGAVATASRIPDIIGNLRVDQPWGAAQLSAAFHPVRSALYPTNALFPLSAPFTFAGAGAFAGAYGYPYAFSNSIGFAVQGGLQFNLDMIAPGDKLWLQATYAKGAIGYVSGANMAFVGGPSSTATYGIGLARQSNAYGWNNAVDNDCVWTYSGKCDLSSAFAIVGAFKHYWTPTVSSGLFGSYYSVSYSGAAQVPVSPFTAVKSVGITNYKESRLGTNLVWTPVKNFDLGAELTWIHTNTTRPFGLAPDVFLNLIGLPSWKNTNDAFYGKLRAIRAF